MTDSDSIRDTLRSERYSKIWSTKFAHQLVKCLFIITIILRYTALYQYIKESTISSWTASSWMLRLFFKPVKYPAKMQLRDTSGQIKEQMRPNAEANSMDFI